MYFFEPVREEYLDEIADIYNYYVLYSTVMVQKEKVSREGIRNKIFLPPTTNKSFLIKLDEDILGYCAVLPTEMQEPDLQTAEINIYLKTDYTDQGIGSNAISFLENIAKENSINTLVAGVCSENFPCIKLFRKNGYNQYAHQKKVGEKFGRALDVIYLKKHLS